MEQDQLGVCGQPNVKLDPRTAELFCLAQTGHSVFRRARCDAAMADDRGEKPIEGQPTRWFCGTSQGSPLISLRRREVQGDPARRVRPQFAAFTCS
jgi:hypothetical protein